VSLETSQPMKFGCKVMGPVPVVRGLGKAASCNCSGSKQHCGKGPSHATVCFPKRRRPGSSRPPSRNHFTLQQTHRILGSRPRMTTWPVALRMRARSDKHPHPYPPHKGEGDVNVITPSATTRLAETFVAGASVAGAFACAVHCACALCVGTTERSETGCPKFPTPLWGGVRGGGTITLPPARSPAAGPFPLPYPAIFEKSAT